MANAVQSYHHGDLRSALIEAQRHVCLNTALIVYLSESWQKMPECHVLRPITISKTRVRLSAIATKGLAIGIPQLNESSNKKTKHHRHVSIIYARIHWLRCRQPRDVRIDVWSHNWQNQAATNDLKEVAFRFQFQVTMTRYWQDKGLLPNNQDALRLTGYRARCTGSHDCSLMVSTLTTVISGNV